MNYMLDTNILIYFIKNKPPAVADKINALDDNDSLSMSYVTFAELLKGAEGSTRKSEVLKRLQALTRLVPVLYPVSRSICEHYAVQASRLKSAGTPISGNDLWIACHALSESATLVTNNIGEFQRVADLPLVNWAV